jgi:chromosome segregation and condensation protein ScpB
MSSQLEEFLDDMANKCDEKTLRSIKAKEVFYQGGRSRAGNPVYYWVTRKFRSANTFVLPATPTLRSP